MARVGSCPLRVGRTEGRPQRAGRAGVCPWRAGRTEGRAERVGGRHRCKGSVEGRPRRSGRAGGHPLRAKWAGGRPWRAGRAGGRSRVVGITEGCAQRAWRTGRPMCAGRDRGCSWLVSRSATQKCGIAGGRMGTSTGESQASKAEMAHGGCKLGCGGVARMGIRGQGRVWACWQRRRLDRRRRVEEVETGSGWASGGGTCVLRRWAGG